MLVDFYATWCGPCQAMAPILVDLKQQLRDSIKVLKVDVDKNQQAAQAYRVLGVPTLILFVQGKQVWRKSGVVPATELEQVVRAHC